MKLKLGDRPLYDAVKLLEELPPYQEFVEAVISNHKGDKKKLDAFADKAAAVLERRKPKPPKPPKSLKAPEPPPAASRKSRR